MKTAIVGTGFVGRAWAISFARAGHDVNLWDADPDAPAVALAYIEGILPELTAADLLDGQDVSTVMARLRPVSALSDAVADVAYVQENTPERVEVKRQIFLDLDTAAPATAILASSTSALLPSRFVEDVPGRSRCLVCHPINPPYLVPAVEVCPSPGPRPMSSSARRTSCGAAVRPRSS